MRRKRRRKIHYSANSLYDGTVLAANPIRKPIPKVIKRDNLIIDDDGVAKEWFAAGTELIQLPPENRFRFMNIMANRINIRRALREIVLPEFASIHKELMALRNQLDRIEKALGE